MQLSPNENYPIFYGIINHTDTNTYYVRTVIYDSSHNVLDTVNLEDKGNQNFLKIWKVPYDNVFQRGKWVLLVTSVYTDSGYTTKSENYGDEFETHLIQERWNMATMASIGGGGGTDIGTIKKAVKEEINKLKFPTPKEFKQKEYGTNFSDIATGLSTLKKAIETIPTEQVSLRSLENSIDDLIDEVKAKPVTPVTNLKPIAKAIDTVQKVRNDDKKEIRNLFATLEKNFMAFTQKTMEDAVQKHIPDIIQNNMKNASFSVPLNLGQPQVEEKRKKVNGLKAKFGLK